MGAQATQHKTHFHYKQEFENISFFFSLTFILSRIRKLVSLLWIGHRITSGIRQKFKGIFIMKIWNQIIPLPYTDFAWTKGHLSNCLSFKQPWQFNFLCRKKRFTATMLVQHEKHVFATCIEKCHLWGNHNWHLVTFFHLVLQCFDILMTAKTYWRPGETNKCQKWAQNIHSILGIELEALHWEI